MNLIDYPYLFYITIETPKFLIHQTKNPTSHICRKKKIGNFAETKQKKDSDL